MAKRKKSGGSVGIEHKWKNDKGENIFWDVLNGLCEIHCTPKEICSVLKASWDQMDYACRRTHSMTFSEYRETMNDGGKASLRRMQWQSAEKGNVTMQIWLGKNILRQNDSISISQEITAERDVKIAREAVERNPDLIDAIFPVECDRGSRGKKPTQIQ